MENSLKAKWYNSPTKKQLILFTILWFVSVILFVVGTTGAFTESFLNKKYAVIYIILAGSTLSTTRLIRNYARNKQ